MAIVSDRLEYDEYNVRQFKMRLALLVGLLALTVILGHGQVMVDLLK